MIDRQSPLSVGCNLVAPCLAKVLPVCDKVEQSITESILKAEALRQSILKNAFEGKLLSQGKIGQCKAAADYEPASVLFKKIKAEKTMRITNEKLRITKKRSMK